MSEWSSRTIRDTDNTGWKFRSINEPDNFRDVNLLFDSSQASGLRKALSDIETAPSIQQVNGFINSASMDKVISDKQRQKIIIDALNEYVNSKRGNEYYDQEKYDEAIQELLNSTVVVKKEDEVKDFFK